MMRAVIKGATGRPLLVLGLDRENVLRLTAGKPIDIDGEEHGMGLPMDIFILFGESLQDIADELRAAGIEFPQGDG